MIAILLMFASIQCGIPPLPPIGCDNPPVCMCDSHGNCHWEFACG